MLWSKGKASPEFYTVTIERYRADRLASEKPPARSTLNYELPM